MHGSLSGVLLAVDTGNSHSVFGLHDGTTWVATWRRGTDVEDTADEVAAWLSGLFALGGHAFEVDGVVIGSVVPGYNSLLAELAKRYFHTDPIFLTGQNSPGLVVEYDPPTAVGADRIANAIGALAIAPPPIVVIDFGTATTFDVVGTNGAYIGGAILPGPITALQSLTSRTAKLPAIELRTPDHAIGRNTVESIASGAMFGTAGAIDALSERIARELGQEPTFIATGGLAGHFAELCRSINRIEPMLTLDGLRIYRERVLESDPLN